MIDQTVFMPVFLSIVLHLDINHGWPQLTCALCSQENTMKIEQNCYIIGTCACLAIDHITESKKCRPRSEHLHYLVTIQMLTLRHEDLRVQNEKKPGTDCPYAWKSSPFKHLVRAYMKYCTK